MKMLRTLSLVMLSWFAYAWLTRVHWVLGAVVWVLAVTNLCTVFMIREKWAVLDAVLRVAVGRKYVAFVCRCTGDQVPASSSSAAAPVLLLHSKREVEKASQRARQIVRGHDAVIDRLLTRIHENLTLRKRQKRNAGQGPLASFLLLGPEGVGKKYLTRVLAKLLYREGPTNVFPCDQLLVSQLTGSNGGAGELEPVRRDAHRILVFEHIDQASPELVQFFAQLLTSGKVQLGKRVNPVSLQDTVIVFTSTSGCESLAEILRTPSKGPAYHPIDRIADATNIDHQLLHAVTEFAYCGAPSDCVKSEVIALLLAQECRAHGTELTHVDPEIIATHVLQLDNERGFSAAPPLVKKLMRRPLVAAAEGNHKSLSLRVRCSHLDFKIGR